MKLPVLETKLCCYPEVPIRASETAGATNLQNISLGKDS